MQDAAYPVVRDSETAGLVSRIDWARTPLGPMENWPQSLKTSLSICLACRFPIIVWWGPDMVVLYNDDYIPVLGKKHPAAMGGNGREVWADVWPVVGPMLHNVVRTGKAEKAEDLLLLMNRVRRIEETYFSFSYSPIEDESGGVGGIFTPVIETTEKVIGHRRIEKLRVLGNLPRAVSLRAACEAAAAVLSDATADIPFGMLYTVDEAHGQARLAASFGWVNRDGGAPHEVSLDDPASPWPLRGAIDRKELRVVSGLHLSSAGLPHGAWGAAVEEAVIMPIMMPGHDKVDVVLVAAVSPHRPLDDGYLSFYKLLADQLEATISEALSYEAERKRLEALAEIDRAKTTFFSNVSHELRTPLTLMLGPISEVMRDQSISSEAAEKLAVVQRNGIRLLKLVNGLLDFSRIEAGKMTASFEPVELSSYTAELAGVFRSAVERAGMTLDVDCPPLSEPVYVDRAMWEKVVLNLLSNAFKFTFEGKISVRLFDAPDGIKLVVADSGVGIEKAKLSKVFERFHRIEGSRARTYEGTGIGLALVRDLVELHGGAIGIDSEPGRGTTLTVTLPHGKAHLPSEQVVEAGVPHFNGIEADAYMAETDLWLAAPGSGKDQENANRDGDLVYVVDDNADMRNYIGTLLGRRYRVQYYANGLQALQAINTVAPALVISDVMMPEMDGYELLAALKGNKALADLPVMLLSARAGEESRISGMQAGADEYLEKPFSGRELLAKVDALLLRSQVRSMESRQAKRLAAIFEQAPVAIAILRGPEHMFELANPLYLDLVGKRDLIGKTVRAALPEVGPQRICDLLDSVYHSGRPYVGRAFRLDLVRGTPAVLQECYFDFVYQPMHDEEGRVDGIAVVVFEVTETIKAKQAAEVASRAKDEFMAMLGHELRNPLAPIMTALELMKLRGMEGGKRERNIIERQAMRLVGLVDDLLDVSRVARGKINLRKKRVELSVVVADAVETVSPLMEERGHMLRILVPPHGLEVNVDRQRMGQVFCNLLANAAKYSDNGATITVRARREGDHFTVDVSDTGHGIAANMREHIFDMFYQDGQSVARSRGGLGLGLTIVRSLVELHGGSVSVYSEGREKGSTFTVKIPVAADHPGAADSEEQYWEKGTQAAAPKHSILLVDDNVDAAGGLRELLEAQGHTVQLAFDGPSALEKIKRGAIPDLAILDIGLPGMDGYELCERIRALPGASRMRLVALSGYGQESNVAKSLAAGFHYHAVKPIAIGALQKIIGDLLDE